MTALNVLQQSNAIHLIVDGIVLGCECPKVLSKVWTLPLLNAAISVTGGTRSLYLCGKLAYEANLAGYSRPEYLIANLATLLKDVQEKYRGAVPEPKTDEDTGDHFIIVVAAWLDRPITINGVDVQAGPLTAYLASHTTSCGPAYSVILCPQIKQVWLMPDFAPIPQECAAAFGNRDLDAVDVDEIATGCIEIQRRCSETPLAIGGAAIVTSITENEIRQRVIKRWPEHVREAGGWNLEDEIL